jgi:hypothetical protein
MNDFEFIEHAKRQLLKNNLSLQADVSEALLIGYLLEEGEAKKEARKEIEELIAINTSRSLFSRKPSFYVPPLSNGEIRIGRVVQGMREGSDYCINAADLQHLGIFAATYSGKTTLLATILTQLDKLKQPIKWLAFDFKRDLRSLSRNYNVKVLRWNWLKINPLQPPPNVPLVQWMTFIADIMAHVFGWFHASENYLLQFMQRAYDAKPDGYPTFRTLRDLILTNEEASRRVSEYRDVCLNRIESMLLVMGDVLDTETSFPIHGLLNENVVIELDGMRRDEANYLVEYFLAYIFCYRLANGERGEISHLNVFDEASRYFFKGRQFRETTTELGISFLDTVPQIIRDYKEGLLCAAQEPSLISHSLMSNLRTKIVGYLSEGQDIDAICDSLNFDDEDRQELGKLGERGYWIVKRAGEEPLVVRTDDFPIAKDMTDDELQKRMDGFIQHLTELSKQTAPVVRHKKIIEEPKIVAPEISADAWNVLVNVSEHPFFGIRSRCKSMQLSARRIEKAVQELGLKQLAAPVEVPLGNFRPVKFLMPTTTALNLLANVGHNTSLWKKIGNTGFEHSLFQILIAFSFRNRGLRTTIEKTLPSGRRVDVYVESRERIGIEIELTTTNIEEKIRGIDSLDRLIVLVKDEKVFHDFVAFLRNAPNEKVRIARVNEFLRENSIRNSHGTGGINPFSADQTRPDAPVE